MADPFDKPQSYIAVPNPVQPTLVQEPASWGLNAEGSEYVVNNAK